MTITFLGEEPGSRAATNDQGSRTYSRAFKLRASSTSEGPFAVGSHASLPVIGSAHPDDSSAFCTQISVVNSEPWQGWNVACSYTDERSIDPNPKNDEVVVSFSSEIYQEAVFKDVFGNGVMNSAGDYFVDPAPTRDTQHLIIKIKSNHLSVPPFVLGYQNAVNSANFTVGGLIVSQQTAKVQRIEVSEGKKRSGTEYYEFTSEIMVKDDGWRMEPMDIGFNEIKTDGKPGAAVLESDLEKPKQPIFLDGAGKKIVNPTPANVYFQNYQVYLELPFSALPGIT